MPFHDLLHNRQSDTRSWMLFVVYTLEHPENPFVVPGIDPDAVIANGDYPLVNGRHSADGGCGAFFFLET
jgi:hypothetical protein